MKCHATNLALVFVLFTGMRVSAHETWLLPARFLVAADEEVVVDLTSGMAFPKLDHAIKPERVAKARYSLGGEAFDLRNAQEFPKSLRWVPRFSSVGVATIGIELKPREIELNKEQVHEYFEEINASRDVRAEWARIGKDETWRETYTKFAKTFVKVGDTAMDRSWAEPTGMAFELIPGSDPFRARVGDTFSAQLLKDNKPLVDQAIGFIVEGEAKRTFATTNAEGRVQLPLSRSGRTLVYAVDLRRGNGDRGWRSTFTTLSLEVKAATR